MNATFNQPCAEEGPADGAATAYGLARRSSSRLELLTEPAHELTALLVSAESGVDAVWDRLVPLVYDESHVLARTQLPDEHSASTLTTTELVHEACVRLVDSPRSRERTPLLLRCRHASDAPHLTSPVFRQLAGVLPAGLSGGRRVMSTHSFSLIASLAFVVGTLGDEAARTDVTASAPSVVTITATDYAFQAPDTIAAGFTTFRLVNNSDQIHMAQLIRLEPGRTMDEYIEAYSESFRSRGPRPEWAKRVGGPGAAPPHGTSNATQVLEPGSYLWVCFVNPPPDRTPHVMKRMAKAFVVRATDANTPGRTPPKADVVMRLIDFGFTVSPALAPGRHTIRVENAGREPHEIGIMKLAPGTTEDSVQKVRDWMQNPDGPPPASVSAASLVGGISSLTTGGEAYFEADLTPGDYLLFCFVTAQDGRPHTAHGMVQHIRVG